MGFEHSGNSIIWGISAAMFFQAPLAGITSVLVWFFIYWCYRYHSALHQGRAGVVDLGAGPTVHVEVLLSLRGEDRTLGPVVAASMDSYGLLGGDLRLG